MKGLMRAVDRFCARHPGFGIRNLMIYIVIGNAMVFLVGLMDTTGTLYGWLYFSADKVLAGQVWRLITFIFVPDNSQILWLAISLYFYYFIGSSLESAWGTPKFTIYYISGMLFNIIYGLLIRLITKQDCIVSASYLNLSMFFSFATLYPDTRVLLFFFIPVKIKWLALLDAAYFLIAVVTNPFPINLLPVVAVLNYLLFFGSWLFDFVRPSGERQKRKAKTVKFRQEVNRIKYQRATTPYTRKCEVCGRTDTDNPGLEFRYCSRCQGFHCFCIDHINNHTHFTQ